MSIAPPEYEVFDAAGFRIRPPRPDLLHFCQEMQGVARQPMEALAMRRVAAVWRGPGTFEERMMGTIAAANAESPTLWEEISTAVVLQDRYEGAVAELYFAQLREEAESAPTEALRKLRRKHLADERIAFIARDIRLNPHEL